MTEIIGLQPCTDTEEFISRLTYMHMTTECLQEVLLVLIDEAKHNGLEYTPYPQEGPEALIDGLALITDMLYNLAIISESF